MIIDKVWFASCIGIVKCTHEHESGFHYYIGTGEGLDEDKDAERILHWGARFPREAGIALFGPEVVIAPQTLSPYQKARLEAEQYDQSHGSFFDRGSADSYYGRPINPHRGGVGGDSGPRLEPKTIEDVQAYNAGYAFNELYGDKKVY